MFQAARRGGGSKARERQVTVASSRMKLLQYTFQQIVLYIVGKP